MENKIVPAETGKGRKRIGDPDAWKKNKEKRERSVPYIFAMFTVHSQDCSVYEVIKSDSLWLFFFVDIILSTCLTIATDMILYCESTKAFVSFLSAM